MKILHVIPSVSPLHGGPSRAIVDMERALAARGIEVTTVTTNDDGDRGTLPVECGRPVTTPHATRWYFPRTAVTFKVSLRLGQWLRKSVKEFDVVHAHALFSFAPVTAAIIARRAGVPYVLRPLGVLANYGMTRHHPLLKRVSFALIERRLVESASAVHFTSMSEQVEAEALGLKCRSVVIPLGTAFSGITTDDKGVVKTKSDEFNLLFLSRIDRKKNLDGLLQGLQLALSKCPNLTLNIAGTGDSNYIAALQALTRTLGLDDYVRWMGYLDGSRKSVAMKAASAFVLPSHSENFGIAVAEALAAGLPCLISRGVAISADIERAGAGIVIGTSPNEIASGIERMLNNPGGIATMSAAARALAANAYSLNGMGERLEELYRSILTLEPPRRNALAS
jgi:glycosyltransferase involved in cell wall biosynthesis